MEIERNRREKVSINIISLIDILFFLILFLMLCTNFSKDLAIDVSMADRLDGSEATPALAKNIDREEENMIRVSISPLTVALDNIRYSKQEFEEVMAEKIADDPRRRINIRTEEGATVQNLVDVIDIMRLKGASNVIIDR